MGVYINPGNSAFAKINGRDYVDKTMLIERVNRTLGGAGKLTCVSRPRRFGKSYAARMLTAYYDCSCDSRGLFDDKLIAATKDYEHHLNRYNVVYLEITSFISQARREGTPLSGVPNMIVSALSDELDTLRLSPLLGGELKEKLTAAAEQPGGRKFVFVIDEWDAIIREAKDDPEAQKAYLDLLL